MNSQRKFTVQCLEKPRAKNKMAARINPPVFHEERGYDRYKLELLAWKEVTDVSKKKQGIAIALSLPDRVKEKVFDNVELDTLKGDDSLDTLVTYLDLILKKDELEDCLEKFENFEDYVRGDSESVSDYIDNFDQRYIKIKNGGLTLPPEILAFKLLRRAKISKEEKMLVLTGMDYKVKNTLYDQTKKSLKKFLGDGSFKAAGGSHPAVFGASGGTGTSAGIKLEPAFLAEHEEALYAAGFTRRSRGGSYRGRGRQFSGRSGARKTVDRPINPDGPDGRPLTCRACGSFRHFLKECPDSWENREKPKNVNIVSENNSDAQQDNLRSIVPDEYAVLFTGLNRSNVSLLGREAQNCAVLDSACSSTVCGQDWLNGYLDSMNSHDFGRVKHTAGTKTFKFGGGTRLKSQGEYLLPAVIAGREVFVRTDVVDSDIPLLLSREAMKKAEVKLDLVKDTAQIFGKSVSLNLTSSGHYCVPIDRLDEIREESVCAVLSDVSSAEQRKILLKLHRQFAHPTDVKMISLLKDAGVWRESLSGTVTDIYNSCNLCKRYKNAPPRPVVCMPMASRFNSVVAMDLKQWDDGWIFHIIDMWSRFSVSVFIKRKQTSVIIDKLIEHWIGVFGVMEAILTDNGGEFNSEEMREVSSILDVRVCTTAAESPWSNGLCERVHCIVDGMLHKLRAEYPATALSTLLCWTNMAKNALQMWQGYSSYQLVFGKNPNLPSIMCEKLPALEGYTRSEVFAKHLNTLHAARRAFIESEANERLRRALRSKVRVSEQVFENGDSVYYKRDGKEKWLGPAKVVFQDGKVVFVRHGGVFVRVSTNRLVRVDEEFSSPLPNMTISETVGESGVTAGAVEHRVVPPPTIVSASSDNAITSRSESIADDIGASTDKDGSDNNRNDPNNDATLPKINDVIEFRSLGSDQWTVAHVMSRAGKATGRYCDWFNVALANTNEALSMSFKDVEWRKQAQEDVNIVMVPPSEHDSFECEQAKNVELEKLKHFETYEEVKYDGQPCISTRWVIWRKGDNMRARLVARGFEENAHVQRDSPTVGKDAIRLVLAIAASCDWTLKTTDIKSAFLQGKPVERDIFLTPPPEAGLPSDRVWQLRRCLYGLNDAARQFYHSVLETLLLLGCQNSALDPSLFYKHDDNGRLLGIIVSHIDDFLHAGDQEFDDTVMNPLRKRFVAGKLEESKFTYVGFCFTQLHDGILLDQDRYVDSINQQLIDLGRLKFKQEPLKSTEITQLRMMAGKLNWLVHGSRPDMAFELVEISMKFKQGTVADLLRAEKALRRLRDFKCKVFFPRLGLRQCWRLVVFTDASHANLSDGISSMGAYVVFLIGENKRCCPLVWNASKIKRVVRSTLAAEALSLMLGLEAALYVRSILSELLITPKIPVIAYVDNRSVVEAVHSTKLVDDKRLRIDIGAIKQCLSDGTLSALRWCPGDAQLADCMTKKGAAGHHLLRVFQNGKIDVDA